ncbi:glycosyltransferase [Microbacterium sp. EYE_5]|uniref:glycosyltransferase family 2 protein n=1 Tax=unclassified Microbacterium TaxID=2609290 RepID=UPI0020034AB0|nr:MULTISPECIES: glycosyltransferase family 2 protein [unclassified Microbacterium]MCK6081068.1 glycosyltransferase [Microbacterium sp. EYE_382]MCK6086338.1 glycosyltransferase [Microbacterium sp. EYE_384]MCK6124164.1 glycosyltransferase [Microbacterium sp. EYE_80]MCK6127073.1 glycosyltransferase [Microbacterium sp. EYE_79]MCK6142023.1 glycosyltransferase [Microbacterium sp. EYE_39]
MPTPSVTVIVPGRDVGTFASEALDSLRAQRFTSWRAILVDDASQDATATVFAAAARDDDRFTLIRHDVARGLGASRNEALAHVETPFVGFFDADDVMTPGALGLLVGSLEASGSDVAVGAYVRLRADASGRYSPGTVQPWVAASTSPARTRTTLAEHPDVSGNIVAWSKVSRTELWGSGGLRFAEGKAYEDQIVAQRLYAQARAIDVIPDVVVHWRERADGTSITQRRHALPVLQDYLDGMRGGIDVLDAAGHPAAARARVRLILDMDVPALIRVAEHHPDDAYRRILGEFTRDLTERASREDVGLDPASRPLLAAARQW